MAAEEKTNNDVRHLYSLYKEGNFHGVWLEAGAVARRPPPTAAKVVRLGKIDSRGGLRSSITMKAMWFRFRITLMVSVAAAAAAAARGRVSLRLCSVALEDEAPRRPSGNCLGRGASGPDLPEDPEPREVAVPDPVYGPEPEELVLELGWLPVSRTPVCEPVRHLLHAPACVVGKALLLRLLRVGVAHVQEPPGLEDAVALEPPLEGD